MKNSAVRGYFVHCAVIVCILTFLGGCSTVGRIGPVDSVRAVPDQGKTDKGWWYARFHIQWDQGQEPAWHTDLVIAHRIVAPVLSRYGRDILLWRIHRRAAPDAAGHQFSFIFYCTPETARKVYATIQANSCLNEMKQTGLILEDIYDDTGTILRPGIGATSDAGWSQPVRDAWPWFIMGVCQTWMGLIDSAVEKSGEKPATLPETMELYRKVNETVEESWAEEGAHAYLHHMNAIFGYAPLNIGKQRVRF